jgi:hypothetical protein
MTLEPQIKEYKAPETLDDFKAVESLDEEQILMELQGKAIDKLFYDTGKMTALSWAGVKYFAIQLGHMQIQEVKLEESPESYKAIAWAYDKAHDLRVMGAAEQSKTTNWNNKLEKDPFALAKVVSKAQRNALRNLIPETMISEAFKAWKLKQVPPK